MREILFRGKRKDNGKWVEGFYTQKMNPYTPDGLPVKHFILDLAPFGVDVLPETVGQFTGLTDKNGVKIFEGDIVEYDDEIGKVVYMTDNAAFDVFFDTWNTSFSAINERYIEVIGNIHDNPELLEVGDNNE